MGRGGSPPPCLDVFLRVKGKILEGSWKHFISTQSPFENSLKFPFPMYRSEEEEKKNLYRYALSIVNLHDT